MSQDTAFENLANAIILKAMEDYSAALRYMRHHMSPEFLYKSQIKPTNAYKAAWSHHRHERWACEHFFKSDWCRQLTVVDPDLLVKLATDKSYFKTSKGK